MLNEENTPDAIANIVEIVSITVVSKAEPLPTEYTCVLVNPLTLLRNLTNNNAVISIMDTDLSKDLITALPTNQVRSRKGSATKLKSIIYIDVKYISVSDLRLYARRNGYAKSRNISKHDICVGILQLVDTDENPSHRSLKE